MLKDGEYIKMVLGDYIQKASDKLSNHHFAYPNEEFVQKSLRIIIFLNIIALIAHFFSSLDEFLVRNLIRVLPYIDLASILIAIKYSESNIKWILSFTRHASRFTGFLLGLPVRKSWRVPLITAFSRIFSVNLSEVKDPLSEFPSLNAFFTRRLKENSRHIDRSILTSPCDGRVMSFGLVDTSLESIKGRSYPLETLLTGRQTIGQKDYKEGLKHNKKNGLYYVSLYLACGDYHRFHSACDWEISHRRHLYGYLLGVFPFNLWRRSDIFVVNERVVYTGKWKFGVMNYVAVAAYNVGDVAVHCDPTLKTNKPEFGSVFETFEEKQVKFAAKKGEEFGLFNAGSTIVLVFEAPEGIEWKINRGQRIQVGNSLINI